MRIASCRSWLVLAVLVVCVVTLHAPVKAADAMYRYIPVLDIVTPDQSDNGCMYISDQICRDAGSYIPGDVSEVLHNRVAEVAGAARSGTWYSFLGADTTVDSIWAFRREASVQLPECTRGIGDPWTALYEADQVKRDRVNDRGCIWRWRSGRWLDIADLRYDSLPAQVGVNSNIYVPGEQTGVAFFAGNDAAGLLAFKLDNEFPIYFKYDATQSSQGVTLTANNCREGADCSLRPGRAHSRQLMAVGSGSAFTWSDGRTQGGYPYTQLLPNVTYESISSYSNTDDVANPWTYEINSNDATTISNHLVVCMMYTPARYDKELYNTSSQLQNLWWLIFLLLLFVICLIIFIIAVCCQEREDMDEPPEDAPEWADTEARSAQRPKRVVSQRSFRQQNDDYYSEGDKYEELDGDSAENPLQGGRGSGRVSWQ